eukprot:1398999-Rhodomonas_salina.1
MSWKRLLPTDRHCVSGDEPCGGEPRTREGRGRDVSYDKSRRVDVPLTALAFVCAHGLNAAGFVFRSIACTGLARTSSSRSRSHFISRRWLSSPPHCAPAVLSAAFIFQKHCSLLPFSLLRCSTFVVPASKHITRPAAQHLYPSARIACAEHTTGLLARLKALRVLEARKP